jgi:phosphomannomutase
VNYSHISKSLKKTFSNEVLNAFISACLEYIAKLDIPIKRYVGSIFLLTEFVVRGTFVEFRTGMLNVSPIGRNCSQDERDAFEKFDHEHQIRAKMIEFLKAKFPDLPVTYSIGGQISFDVFPNGWDKTYSLQFLEADGFAEIHFFGDKTTPGGNDFEIFSSPKVSGHTVTSPEDTKMQVSEVLTKKSL